MEISDPKQKIAEELRRGPWTVEEDLILTNYITMHGHGRWNSLAKCAGLKRTGKSCRLRWLNYLRPDVRHSNITAEEQLLILELQARWGNRWSKIAQHLPGRTDNQIKNYWRTKVQKHANQLQCEAHSHKFRDAIQLIWMPRLLEIIRAAAYSPTPISPASGASAASAVPKADNTTAVANGGGSFFSSTLDAIGSYNSEATGGGGWAAEEEIPVIGEGNSVGIWELSEMEIINVEKVALF